MDELREHFEDLLESDQSDPQIQFEIGKCYLEGSGVERDLRLAEKWLGRAAEQGHEEARALLNAGQAEKKAEQEVTEESLPRWCVRAEDGDPEAQYKVAVYLRNRGVSAIDRDVRRYLTSAAEQGHPEACLILGRELVEFGRSGEDLERGVEYLRNAADCNLPDAYELLGGCYAKGTGVQEDPEKAEQYYCKWAEQGGAKAALRLALRYAAGEQVPQSRVKAMVWVQKAQDAGMADAQAQYDRKLQALREEQEKRRRAAEERERQARQAEEARAQAARQAQYEAQQAAQRQREEEARRKAEAERQQRMEAEARARQRDRLEAPVLAVLIWLVVGFPIGWLLTQTSWFLTRQVLARVFIPFLLWRLRWLHPALVWIVWYGLYRVGRWRVKVLTTQRLEAPEVKLMAWFQQHGPDIYKYLGWGTPAMAFLAFMITNRHVITEPLISILGIAQLIYCLAFASAFTLIVWCLLNGVPQGIRKKLGL